MNLSPLRPFALFSAGLILFTQLPVSASDAVDHFDVGLVPADWTTEAGANVEAKDGQLQITAPGKSTWASPRARWSVPATVEVEIQADPGQGKLIGQVEWFDRGGAFIEAGEFCRLEGGKMDKGSSTMIPIEGAAQFGVKLWVESDVINASVAALTVRMTHKWQEPVKVEAYVEPSQSVPELAPGLEVRGEGTTWSLALKDDAKSAAVHFPTRIDAADTAKIMVPILELSPSAAVSVQLLCWDVDGTFLGEAKVLSDVAEAGDYEVSPGSGSPALLPGTEKVSVKVWCSGNPSSTVRLGSILLGRPGVN